MSPPKNHIKACHGAVLVAARPEVMCYCTKFSIYITVTFRSLLVLQVICTLSGYPIYEQIASQEPKVTLNLTVC